MRKLTFILALFLPGISIAGTHTMEGTPFTAGECIQAGSGDTLTTTGAACASGSGGIVSPGTFTWINNFGVQVSTFVSNSTYTINGPMIANGTVGVAGQVLASQGPGQPPTFIDPIVSQSDPSLLKASCFINGSSNTVQLSGTSTVFLSTVQVVNSTVGVVQAAGAFNVVSTNTILGAGTAEIGNVKNSGTFATQAAQSGTWTVQPGNTANTTAWKVDGSAVTQPVSGTVTANQGTAGAQGWPVTSTYTVVSTTYSLATSAAQSGTWTVQPGNTPNTTAWVVASTWSVIVASNIYNNTLTPAATGFVQLSADENQRLLITGIPRGQIKQATATLTSNTETVLISSGATGVFDDLCGCIFSNTSATAVRIDLRGQGNGGTINNAFELPATDTRGFWPGCQNPFVQLSSASNWTVQLSASVTDVRVTCQYIPLK